jgi:aspartate kinase
MGIVVQKFGGSSVADAEKIRAVATRVKARADGGDRVVVVVSAMGDSTDTLLSLAKTISPNPPRRELDMLLSCGERIAMALLSMALHELGKDAISFTGSQSGIITDGSHAQARIVEVKPTRIQEELDKGRVVIVAGYQGVSRAREVTTLGRGGSDTTAVALAAALGADCEIYSDVDGVFSADPRVVPQARKLEALSYDEMQELAVAGAKVLNAQAVEFAREQGIVIHARSTYTAGTGTQIVAAPAARARVRGVTCDGELWVLELDERPDLLLSVLAAHQVRCRAMSLDGREGAPRSWFVVPLQDVHGADALEAELKQKLGSALRVHQDLGVVTLVGVGLHGDLSVLQTAWAQAAEVGASVAWVQATPLALALAVGKVHMKELTERLHQALVA